MQAAQGRSHFRDTNTAQASMGGQQVHHEEVFESRSSEPFDIAVDLQILTTAKLESPGEKRGGALSAFGRYSNEMSILLASFVL